MQEYLLITSNFKNDVKLIKALALKMIEVKQDFRVSYHPSVGSMSIFVRCQTDGEFQFVQRIAREAASL